MSSEAPTKEELPGELQRILNTLTDDAQNAALRKCVEMGFDPNKGRIPLEESLINLSQSRDLLLDAISNRKLAQLPLKLQYALYQQVKGIARELAEMSTGVDAVVNFDGAIEELTASVWQFQLQSLSPDALGFHSKLNQLKNAETRIRQVAREAEAFTSLHGRVRELAGEIETQSAAIGTEHESASRLTEQIQVLLKESTELGQKIGALASQIEQQGTTSGQQLATAKQAAADSEAIAAKLAELRTESQASRDLLQELIVKAQQLLSSTESKAAEQQTNFESRLEQLLKNTETSTTTLTSKADASIVDLTSQAASKVDALVSSGEARVGTLVGDSTATVAKAETAREKTLSELVKEFAAKSEAAMHVFATRGDEAITAGNEEQKRLVTTLDELENRIREAIERATGYTLFHSFQKRQLDIAKARRAWGVMLGICVVVSLIASGWFIYSLQFVTNYNAAFYLKLSISIPIIYAIAFCNLQYSHERKLEEEYAFKSSVSISLDPYQRLVSGLVDQTNKEELAKYTEFVIQSVNRVFTSPMDSLFEGSRQDRTYAEKIIKAVGGAIGTATEPLIKGLKR